MKLRVRSALAAVFTAWLAGLAAPPAGAADAPRSGETAILQLKVIEGEDGVHVVGSRSSRPLTVQVTDETGKPVEGVAVSLRMPDEEPSGVFSNGLKTEVLVTGPDGRASAWGIHWSRTPGPLRIRITAVKGHARAGIVSSQYISTVEPAKGGSRGPARPSTSKPHGKWIVIAIAVAGAAAGGLTLGLTRQPAAAGTAGSSASSSGSAGALTSSVQVGPPTITIGKP
jgi:hypothetical protein